MTAGSAEKQVESNDLDALFVGVFSVLPGRTRSKMTSGELYARSLLLEAGHMDTEDIIGLSDKMSALSAGYKNDVVMQAALNLCATVIVNAYDTREEVDRAAGQLAVRLAETVQGYWEAERPH